MNFKHMDDWFGWIETVSDTAWTVDDYGNLVQVSWNLGNWYWQEV